MEEVVFMTDIELVTGFRNGEIPGEQVMTRLFAKAGLEPEIGEQPLIKGDGTFLTDDEGRPLLAREYMTVADKHHATDILLGFLDLPETDPEFVENQELIVGLIRHYVPKPPEEG